MIVDENIVSNIESIATILGIAIAAMWTYWLFVRKRERYPRAETDHDVTYLFLSNGKILLHVELWVKNLGSVLISVDRLVLFVDRIAPLAPHLVEKKLVNHDPTLESGPAAIPFYCVARRTKTYEGRSFEIEPSETDAEHFDFVISGDTQVVQIRSHIHNATRRVYWKGLRRRRLKIGWRKTTYHELDRTMPGVLGRTREQRRGQWTIENGSAETRTAQSGATRMAPAREPGKRVGGKEEAAGALEEAGASAGAVRAEAAVDGKVVETGEHKLET